MAVPQNQRLRFEPNAVNHHGWIQALRDSSRPSGRSRAPWIGRYGQASGACGEPVPSTLGGAWPGAATRRFLARRRPRRFPSVARRCIKLGPGSVAHVPARRLRPGGARSSRHADRERSGKEQAARREECHNESW